MQCEFLVTVGWINMLTACVMIIDKAWSIISLKHKHDIDGVVWVGIAVFRLDIRQFNSCLFTLFTSSVRLFRLESGIVPTTMNFECFIKALWEVFYHASPAPKNFSIQYFASYESSNNVDTLIIIHEIPYFRMQISVLLF